MDYQKLDPIICPSCGNDRFEERITHLPVRLANMTRPELDFQRAYLDKRIVEIRYFCSVCNQELPG